MRSSSSAEAGNIVAVEGLESTSTGDTLAGGGSLLRLEPIWAPEPVVELALEPRTEADDDKLGWALETA